MRAFLTTAMLLAGILTPVAAQDFRAASEEEMAAALQGCWAQEQHQGGLSRKEADGSFTSSAVCFEPDNVVETWVYSVHPKWGGEGLGSSGTYTLSGGRLELRTELSDGWLFGYSAMSCDVLTAIGRAFRLENCTAGGKNWFDNSEHVRAIPNMSFAFSSDQTQGERL